MVRSEPLALLVLIVPPTIKAAPVRPDAVVMVVVPPVA